MVVRSADKSNKNMPAQEYTDCELLGLAIKDLQAKRPVFQYKFAVQSYDNDLT